MPCGNKEIFRGDRFNLCLCEGFQLDHSRRFFVVLLLLLFKKNFQKFLEVYYNWYCVLLIQIVTVVLERAVKNTKESHHLIWFSCLSFI